MIPEFPEFKKLELSDKQEIESITSKFPPYSDFNFTSMWSWDVKEKTLLSKINGNLVVKFTDYLTGEQFYSFFGENDINRSIEMALDSTAINGLEQKLKLVPGFILDNIDLCKFKTEEDVDNFDYVYDVEKLANMNGGSFAVKRKHISFFKKNYISEQKLLDLTDSRVRENMRELFNKWVADKNNAEGECYFENEFNAFSRFLETNHDKKTNALGIFSEGKMIAFAIVENISAEYNISHFQKAITSSYKGLNTFLTREVAKLLVEKKVKYLNCEQDLGLPGLRESKQSYFPCTYSKKISISYIN